MHIARRKANFLNQKRPSLPPFLGQRCVQLINRKIKTLEKYLPLWNWIAQQYKQGYAPLWYSLYSEILCFLWMKIVLDEYMIHTMIGMNIWNPQQLGWTDNLPNDWDECMNPPTIWMNKKVGWIDNSPNRFSWMYNDSPGQ